mmetsp:Transcript_24518/g.37809  ORF Transcript_24518/g.37809 Transcript_24518/m.37809 type:complete len:288 (+) Transcript_24518:901-1764(+)
MRFSSEVALTDAEKLRRPGVPDWSSVNGLMTSSFILGKPSSAGSSKSPLTKFENLGMLLPYGCNPAPPSNIDSSADNNNSRKSTNEFSPIIGSGHSLPGRTSDRRFEKASLIGFLMRFSAPCLILVPKERHMLPITVLATPMVSGSNPLMIGLVIAPIERSTFDTSTASMTEARHGKRFSVIIKEPKRKFCNLSARPARNMAASNSKSSTVIENAISWFNVASRVSLALTIKFILNCWIRMRLVRVRELIGLKPLNSLMESKPSIRTEVRSKSNKSRNVPRDVLPKS